MSSNLNTHSRYFTIMCGLFFSFSFSIAHSLWSFVYSICRDRFLNCLRSLKRIRWWAIQIERVRCSSFDDGSWNTIYVFVQYFPTVFFILFFYFRFWLCLLVCFSVNANSTRVSSAFLSYHYTLLRIYIIRRGLFLAFCFGALNSNYYLSLDIEMPMDSYGR